MTDAIDERGYDRNAFDGAVVRDNAFYDTAFRALVESPELAGLSGAVEQEQLRRYVRRIAGSVFCGAGIDPSVVDFATSRAAGQWGLDHDEVDVMVGTRLLRTTAALITQLR